jgi:hypothetical protein
MAFDRSGAASGNAKNTNGVGFTICDKQVAIGRNSDNSRFSETGSNEIHRNAFGRDWLCVLRPLYDLYWV